MFKKIRLFILIAIGFAIFVCTIVALSRNEFGTPQASIITPQNSRVFVPPTFEAQNNDTEAIAEEARKGDVGSFVSKDNDTSTTSVDRSTLLYKTYWVLALVGYIVLAGLIIFYGRF